MNGADDDDEDDLLNYKSISLVNITSLLNGIIIQNIVYITCLFLVGFK